MSGMPGIASESWEFSGISFAFLLVSIASACAPLRTWLGQRRESMGGLLPVSSSVTVSQGLSRGKGEIVGLLGLYASRLVSLVSAASGSSGSSVSSLVIVEADVLGENWVPA